MRRLLTARWLILAAAAVMAALVVIDNLPVLHAVLGFAVIVLAGLIGGETAPRAGETPLATGDVTGRGDAVLERLIAGVPDPVILVDRDGVVIARNARSSALAPALATGEPVSLALRIPAVIEAIRRAASTGQPQRVEFSERVPVDRWYEAHVAPIESIEGPASRAQPLVILSFRDLTPLRRTEEMRVDFVANASHELRTPLATLSGFIETLQGPARDDATARQRFLAIMKEQASRMARLIDDLLSLSRIELNAHLHPQTPLDVRPLVREVADALQTLARDRGVEVVIADAAEPLVVAGDRDELIRVFENLIENALKYGAAGKRVEISLRSESGRAGQVEAVVSVKDHGPGISPEHLPRLTERFYRVDVGESRAQGGTGLGLALVKHILARHRGRIVIESKLGQGATFSARLPLLAREAGAAAAGVAAASNG